MKTEQIKLSRITVNASNPRTITDVKFQKLINSILVFPKMLELRPIVLNDTYVALGGNMRYRALLSISQMQIDEIVSMLSSLIDYQKKTAQERSNLLEYWEKWLSDPKAIIVKASEFSEDEQREFIIKDNVGFGEWDMDMLANEWDSNDLDNWGLDLWQLPNDSSSGGTEEHGSLTDRFVIPPFSILDTRKGYWQDRKKLWREIIGDNGETRNDTLTASPELKYKDLYQKTRKHREELGISFQEYLDKYVPEEVKQREESKILSHGVSLLDPVMAEIVCRWFGIENGKTFDCFAGDTIFGFVSSYLNHSFTGIELRQDQADINNERTKSLDAKYICDDGQNVAKHIEKNSQDLFFSCPPYYDLEVYSDDEKDASNQKTYEDFLKIIKNALLSALTCLKDDRFAVVVVGDIRDDKTGFYYNYVDDVKRIFFEAGTKLYNELILIETGASTALRAGKYMDSRKVAKMHQNVLVFYKGNPKNIKKTYKKIEYESKDLELFQLDCGNESC